MPEGPYEVRLIARDPAGKTLLAMPRASAVDVLAFHWHRFPLRGTFSYGGPDARFGAKRNGHTHQGQDLIAPEGTPVLAPRGGVVAKVDFQEGGAGHYVVVDGAGEDDTYVFMHLVAGSITVREGQHVKVAMLDCLASMVAEEHFDISAAVGAPMRTGNSHDRLVPFGVYSCKDGHVSIVAFRPEWMKGLLDAMGRPELLVAPRFEGLSVEKDIIEAFEIEQIAATLDTARK